MKTEINKNYKIEIGEVLEGSALLKKQDSNSTRVKFMIKNIRQNKAFDEYFNNCFLSDKVLEPLIVNGSL